MRVILTGAFALVTTLLLGELSPRAHEGHEGEPGQAVYTAVDGDTGAYRVGFGFLPHDPVVGEEVQLEFQFLELGASADARASTGRPLVSHPVRIRIARPDGSGGVTPSVHAEATPGVYGAHHRFEADGEYLVSASLSTGRDTVEAQFPVIVGPDPGRYLRMAANVVVLLIVGAWAWVRVGGRRAATVAPAELGRRLLPVAVGAVVATAGMHFVVGPSLSALALPERAATSITWDAPQPQAGTDTTPPPEKPTSRPTPQAAGPLSADVSARVVAAPGAMAEVVVPVTARVLVDDERTPTLGRTVERGQTLVTLEHHYVQHDAYHLFNLRRPLLFQRLEARRRMLDTELEAARLRYLAEHSGISAQALQKAETAEEIARLEHERAEKLLKMHDAQISGEGLVRRPLKAPISGTITAANFTQGQLAYENEPLFTILDLSRVWVEARLPERGAAQRLPTSMTFYSPAFEGLAFAGKLVRRSDQVDPATRTTSWFYVVENPDELLRVGMSLATEPGRPGNEGPTDDATSSDAEITLVAARREPTASEQTSRVVLTGVVKPKPELVTHVTAPMWGGIEFADRRLNVGDVVQKEEELVHIVLELSIDERSAMEADAANIKSEFDLSRARLAQAEQQYTQAVQLMKAYPDDAFRKQEVKLTDQVYRAAVEEEALLTRQVQAFKGVMKRRDPRVTVVRAPMSGVISDIAFRPGELNMTDEFRRLFTIVDTSRVWIEVPVFENQSAALLRRATKVSLSSPGRPDHPLGRPVAVSGSVDPDTRTLTATFEVPNDDRLLKLGASAQVVIEAP